jgi:hypothetical protein
MNARTLCVAGVMMMACSACTQGTPAALSAGAAAGNPLTPTEIRLPINVSTHMVGEHETPINVGTHMVGEHETPPRDTKANGQVILQISKDALSLSYIHHGVVGAPGPAVVFLYGNAAPGAGRHDGVLAQGTLTAADLIGPLAGHPLSDLIALIQSGDAYVNVHTNDGVDPPNTGPGDFPAGEIRGQL